MEPIEPTTSVHSIGTAVFVSLGLLVLAVVPILIYNAFVLYHLWTGRNAPCVADAKDGNAEGFASISSSIRNSNATYPRIINALLVLISCLFITLFVLEFIGRGNHRLVIDEIYVVMSVLQTLGAFFITGISAFKADGTKDEKQRCRNLHFIFTIMAYLFLWVPQAFYGFWKFCTIIGLASCIICPISLLCVIIFLYMYSRFKRDVERIENRAEAPVRVGINEGDPATEENNIRNPLLPNQGPQPKRDQFCMYVLEMVGFYIILVLSVLSTLTRNRDFSSLQHVGLFNATQTDCWPGFD
jgi:hypothetical protein